MIMEATEAAGYLDKVSVGLDVASSEFKVEGENAYDLDFKTKGADKDTSLKLSGDELMEMYADLSRRYPIVTIEDPFDQNDWENWSKFTAMIGDKVQASIACRRVPCQPQGLALLGSSQLLTSRAPPAGRGRRPDRDQPALHQEGDRGEGSQLPPA
jgi:hypothetical protein